MLEKIIYVVGPPRSGSSLIYNALCSHEKFNPAIPENHITPKLVNSFFQQCYRNQTIESHSIFDSLEDTKSYFKNYLEIFFNKISSKYNVNNLILKSILLSPDIYILYELYPEISYVLIIRDPRDIIVSMLNISENQKKLNRKIHFPRDMKILCDKINNSYRLIKEKNLKEFFNKKVYTIKYEDFIDKPLFHLNKTSKKFSLDIVYNDNLKIWSRSSNIYKDNTQGIDNPYKSDLWNKPLNNSRIGIYKEKLNRNEVNQINKYCKDIIEIFNYY